MVLCRYARSREADPFRRVQISVCKMSSKEIKNLLGAFNNYSERILPFFDTPFPFVNSFFFYPKSGHFSGVKYNGNPKGDGKSCRAAKKAQYNPQFDDAMPHAGMGLRTTR